MNSQLKSLPPLFLSRLQKIFPPGELPHILKAYLLPKPTTFRVNTLKTDEASVLHFFQKSKIKTIKEKSIPNCYYLEGLSQKKIKNLDLYQKGEIYLQNLSSQIPALVLNPEPKERVLDMCASPGSKTTQMAALMQNEGELWALEPDKIRVSRLQHNTILLGSPQVNCAQIHGESYCKKILTESPDRLFDKILVDAPCSGDGTYYVHDKASYSHWSLDFVLEKSKQQKKLLQAAVSVVRPGGKILYSTCSTAPEENEMVVDEILKACPNVELVSIQKQIRIPFFKPALKRWGSIKFANEIEKTCRIYPSEKTEGFYMALFSISPSWKEGAGGVRSAD